MTQLTTVKVRKLPVIELFGPVFEGEGIMAGARTFYIRLGGCQYRCLHCDSMYAVLPNEVKKNSTLMTPRDIVDELLNARGDCDWVTISGGNPTLFELDDLIDTLHSMNFKIKVECQGDPWKAWIPKVDLVVVSPKTVGFAGEDWSQLGLEAFPAFLESLRESGTNHIVKIVIDQPEDVAFAHKIAVDNKLDQLWLSCCTHADDNRDDLGERYAKMGEVVMQKFRKLGALDLRWLPQLHVFAYGHKRGV